MSAQANPTPIHQPGAAPHPAPQPVPIHPQPERAEPGAPPPATLQKPGRSRVVLRRTLMLLGVLVIGGGATYAYLTGGRFVGTDDAYVKSAQLSVTTDVSGLVKSVEVKEGQHVAAGDVLFRLDPEP